MPACEDLSAGATCRADDGANRRALAAARDRTDDRAQQAAPLRQRSAFILADAGVELSSVRSVVLIRYRTPSDRNRPDVQRHFGASGGPTDVCRMTS